MPDFRNIRARARRALERRARASELDHELGELGDAYSLGDRPATPRNKLVALRAERDRDLGDPSGQVFLRHSYTDLHQRIHQASAAVREQDVEWLASVRAGGQQLPRDADVVAPEADPALSWLRSERAYARIFDDADELRGISDDTLVAVKARLEEDLSNPEATFPEGDRHTARAVMAEVHREMKVRPQAHTLSAQRTLKVETARDPDLDAERKIELAAEVRRRATQWLGVDSDNESAFQALAHADRQYSDTVVEAKPDWLEETLGPEQDDEHLALQREDIAARIAHVRFGREVLDDIDPGLNLPANARLLTQIGQYQQVVGMVMPEPQLQVAQEQGFGM